MRLKTYIFLTGSGWEMCVFVYLPLPQENYIMLTTTLVATVSVLIAEIGDKTQLLTLFLVMRYQKKLTIAAAIVMATLVNHALSAYFGLWLSQLIDTTVLTWLVSAGFIIVGLWLLVPDKDSNNHENTLNCGILLTCCLVFFLAEIGDKTQIATVLLASQYQNLGAVVVGSTLGLLLANLPLLFIGDKAMHYLPLRWIRISACLLFCTIGIGNLIWHLTS